MTLDKLAVGDSAVITAVGGEGALRRRLLDMGITPKTQVFVRKMAPLGDPMEIKIRGYTLTLRKDDAGRIDVRKVDVCPIDLSYNNAQHDAQKGEML